MACAVFSAAELQNAAHGMWFGSAVPAGNSALYTDSREDGGGRMFVALEGEKFDAHDFLPSAVSSGAGALCINRKKIAAVPAGCPVPVLLVDDTLTAYQNIAGFHRRRFKELKVAAVTGSVGKTSVKEMLRAVFAAAAGSEDGVLFTVGNTNNQVGVPQNLLRLDSGHRFAVIEMGTNHHGEIAPLSLCAAPDTGVVNSIAPCHLEFLGSLDGVAGEKSHVWDGMAPDGTAVFPWRCDGEAVLEAASAGFRTLRFGTDAAADVCAEFLSGDMEHSVFRLIFPDGSKFDVSWALTGVHQALNAAAAAAVALSLGVAPEIIAAGLSNTVLPGMRMARSTVNGVTYINDAYNANPGSMAAALEMLKNSFGSGSRLVLVLGDMLELGDFEDKGHLDTLNMAQRLFPGARIVAAGPRMCRSTMESDRPAAVTLCRDPAEAGAVLADLVNPGDTVFLKGSRGMALERALPQN